MKRAPAEIGKVFLVGAGPGAPDLLTVRAADILKRADAVFHDALIHPDTLALAAHAEKFAVGKRSGRLSTAQQFINKRLVDAAKKYRTVVRLKGGDPSMFGRAQEEIETLGAAGIPFEIVPGVTAALAAAAELGVSLTQRGIARSVTFATARTGVGAAPNNWAESVAKADTAVLYMAAGQAAEIAAGLQGAGMAADTPIAIVEDASLPGVRHFFMRLSDLDRAADLGITGPAVIMLGRVFAAALAEHRHALSALSHRARASA